MAQATSIEWTDASSNPIRYRDEAGKVVWSCVKTSAGCMACYAEAMAHRFDRGGPFTKAQQEKLTPFLDEKELKRLAQSKTLAGKKVFLCDMTDCFGEWVPFAMLDELFGVLAERKDVTFQILTKRAERMAEYFNEWYSSSAAPENCWLGVSVEDQEYADHRIPELLKIPARVRFLSVEPLLGPVDLRNVGKTTRGDDYDALFGWRTSYQYKARSGSECSIGIHSESGTRIDWVVVGGESGPKARPCNVEWIRSLVRQCKAAEVPVFVKQLGANITGLVDSKGLNHDAIAAVLGSRYRLKDPKGGDMSEFPEDLRVREMPE